MKHELSIYLCHSVADRAQLYHEFTAATAAMPRDVEAVGKKECGTEEERGGEDATTYRIVRWRNLPSRAEDVLCAVSDDEGGGDEEQDPRCAKLRGCGVEIVPSSWLRECIAQGSVVKLPSQQLSAPPDFLPSSNSSDGENDCENVARRRITIRPREAAEPWSKAEDNCVRAVHNAFLAELAPPACSRPQLATPSLAQAERLLLQRGRSRRQVHDRECVLYGQPAWTAAEDLMVLQIAYFDAPRNKNSRSSNSNNGRSTMVQKRNPRRAAVLVAKLTTSATAPHKRSKTHLLRRQHALNVRTSNVEQH